MTLLKLALTRRELFWRPYTIYYFVQGYFRRGWCN